MKVIYLSRREARLVCSSIANVVNVRDVPFKLPGHFIIQSYDSIISPIPTPEQLQEEKNHALFGNIDPCNFSNFYQLGIVYISREINKSESIWCDNEHEHHLLVEWAFRYLNPHVVEDLIPFSKDDTLIAHSSLVENHLNSLCIQDAALLIPVCPEVFQLTGTGVTYKIGLTSSVRNAIMNKKGKIMKFNRVKLVCGRFHRTFHVDSKSTRIISFNAPFFTHDGNLIYETKLSELKFVLGDEFSPFI